MKKILSFAIITTTLFCCAYGQFTEGKIGQALTGYYSGAVPPQLNFDQGGVECFFKLDVPPSELPLSNLMSCGFWGEGRWYLRFRKNALDIFFQLSGKVRFSIREISLADIAPGQWHHVAAVWGKYHDKGFCRIYLDGLLKSYSSVELPGKPPKGTFEIRRNNNAPKEQTFPGAVDEVVLYNIAPSPEMIAARAADPVKNVPEKGVIAHFRLDGNFDMKEGKSCSADEAKKLLRLSAKKAIPQKYADELPYQYRFEDPALEEKKAGELNDGKDSTQVIWGGRNIALVCEMPQVYDVSDIEITVQKHTKGYILRTLFVSIDNGSGEFASPIAIKCYGKVPDKNQKLVDETCHKYVYHIPNPGKVCRIRIETEGLARGSINEIRIRGKK